MAFGPAPPREDFRPTPRDVGTQVRVECRTQCAWLLSVTADGAEVCVSYADCTREVVPATAVTVLHAEHYARDYAVTHPRSEYARRGATRGAQPHDADGCLLVSGQREPDWDTRETVPVPLSSSQEVA